MSEASQIDDTARWFIQRMQEAMGDVRELTEVQREVLELTKELYGGAEKPRMMGQTEAREMAAAMHELAQAIANPGCDTELAEALREHSTMLHEHQQTIQDWTDLLATQPMLINSTVVPPEALAGLREFLPERKIIGLPAEAFLGIPMVAMKGLPFPLIAWTCPLCHNRCYTSIDDRQPTCPHCALAATETRSDPSSTVVFDADQPEQVFKCGKVKKQPPDLTAGEFNRREC